MNIKFVVKKLHIHVYMRNYPNMTHNSIKFHQVVKSHQP